MCVVTGVCMVTGQWATLPDEDTDRQAVGTTDLVPTGEYEDEEEEGGEYGEEDESEESEGENEMVVLDPDHVSMRQLTIVIEGRDWGRERS